MTSGSRLFQRCAPRYENDFCPLVVFKRGTRKSVSEFLNLIVSREEFFEKIFERYVGARPFMDLKTMLAVSRLIISAIVGHFSFCIRASAGAS